ncbi:MAG TPA: hypothetical protein VF747_04495, partial [Blastocatellia bacterium]
MSFRHRFIIALLVAANLIVIGYLFSFRQRSSSAADTVAINKPHSLPLLKLSDDGGKEFDTRMFMGTPLFVLFINPHVQAQVDAYLRVRNQQFKRPVSWLLISSDAGALRSRLPRGNNDVIVGNEYDRLRELFGVPKCCEEWLVFDATGAFKDSGKYDEDRAAGGLKHLVDGEKAYSTDLLLQTLNSTDGKNLLKQAHTRAARSRSGKAVVALFSTACTGCPDDNLIDLLRTQSQKNPDIAFLTLLPDTFTQSDLDSFKTNLEIPFPVELANSELSRQWSLI